MDDREIDDLITKCQNHSFPDDEFPDKLETLKSIPKENRHYEDAQDCIKELEKKLSQLPPSTPPIIEGEERNDDKKEKPKPIWLYILISTLLVVGIGIILIAFPPKNNGETSVTSPEYSESVETNSSENTEVPESSNNSESSSVTSTEATEKPKPDTTTPTATDDTIKVPRVIGYQYEQAAGLLNGLKIERKDDYSNTVEAGKVISQSIVENKVVKKNTKITIVVSRGKKPHETTTTTTSKPATTTSTTPKPVTTTTIKTPQAEKPAAVMTVYFDLNNSTTYTVTRVVTQNKVYGDLPQPEFKGYTFSHWYDSDGNIIDKYTLVSRTEDHTLYAAWNHNKYTVSFNTNGANETFANTTVTYNSPYGTLPNPTKDYHTFDGWYSDSQFTDKITENSWAEIAGDHTLYAKWNQNPISTEWILASQLPSGAAIVEQEWRYTETTTSTATSLNGWTQTGSSWSETGRGDYYYADYPNGYDKGNSLYSKYNDSALKAFSNASQKQEVSSASHYTYIYYHWSNVNASSETSSHNRPIESSRKDSSGYIYFYTFESTTDYPFYGGAYGNVWKADRGRGSYWWFRFPVYKQTYINYEKIYTYQRTNKSEEQVYASDTISNVQRWVKYREK